MSAAKNIVPFEEWEEARKDLLQKEKDFTKLRDELTAARQKMPWHKVSDYQFENSNGRPKLSLLDLFDGKKQLLVYHFMFGPDWNEGCKSCSFWADGFEGLDVHLRHRDTSLVLVSNTSIDKIEAFKKRMGWTIPWVSSLHSDFNKDFHVSFTKEEIQGEVYYNYKKTKFPVAEAPGISVFVEQDGMVYHSYSAYARGLDILHSAYNMLDLTPLGRNEHGKSMYWLKHHDKYEDD